MTDPDGAHGADDASRPAWYRRPRVWALLALVILAVAVGVAWWLTSGDDDPADPTATTETTAAVTTTAAAPPTTAPPPPPTASPSASDRCAAGDQLACDELDDDELRQRCDEGNVDACQVLLARQGDGLPDGDEGP